MSLNPRPAQGPSTWVMILSAIAVGMGMTYLWAKHELANTVQTSTSADRTVARHAATAPQGFDRGMEDLDRRMATLAAQLAALEQTQKKSASAPAAPAGSLATAAANAPNLTHEELMRRGDEQTDAHAAQVERAIATEQFDPTWAPGAEKSIRGMFEDKDMQAVRLVDARCRATLCRIEIAENESAQGDDFEASFRKMLIRTPWQGQGFGRVYDPFGPSPKAVLFLAREGATLPLTQ